MCKWEDISLEEIEKSIITKYSDLKTRIKENTLEVVFNKDVVLDITIGTLEEPLSNWNSLVLVHLNLMQSRTVIRGQGLAVDNYADLEEELAKMIKVGREWADIQPAKTVRKKLV